ncbi:aminotransferase class V-fold PLP-dependent enzyme [Rubrivirga litoralis]|uniref:Aminotransferase class V-fold PLP-dependent enzyme n=1 Tax=Rubrivirga litoralis TaxID=3075598 RepID=A0ABU3BN32_9BACT|nr:aminotransferase class V-fold PLP-dependent enzyme [Rubrivirga sp. F394]MDT0630673.1 aminotransferase class V-fold PLP-dependent enzyme [Rubrivirga sp. F394]
MLDLRDRFATPPPPAVELRAFTHGLMPRTVPAMMQAFCDDWAERGVDAWNRVPDRWDLGTDVGWWSLPEALGDRWLAPLLGAEPGTCILQPNVHWTVQCLLSCDEPFEGAGGAGRTEVVLTDAEFPSVRHSVQRWAGLRDVRPVEVAAGADGFVDVDAVCDAVTDRTAWVVVSHVGFATGEVLTDDALRRIADAAHRHGALFAIDGYHATASVVVDAAALGADVYFGGLLKEACGSTGNAYLWVHPGLDLRPRLAGWLADADPFAFADAPADHPEVRRRFLAGTTAVASMYHAVEGLRVLLGEGIAAVRADTLAKGARAIERAEALGLGVRSPREAERRGAMLVLEVEHADRLAAWLKSQDVYADSRKGRVLRLAPFVWNPPADVDRAFDAVDEALRTGAHMEYEAPAEGGPVT